MPLRQGTRSCATGVARLEAVTALFACSRLFCALVHVLWTRDTGRAEARPTKPIVWSLAIMNFYDRRNLTPKPSSPNSIIGFDNAIVKRAPLGRLPDHTDLLCLRSRDRLCPETV